MDGPIVLLREEAVLLRRLAARHKTRPGEVLRRLIICEAARQGVLEEPRAPAAPERPQEAAHAR